MRADQTLVRLIGIVEAGAHGVRSVQLYAPGLPAMLRVWVVYYVSWRCELVLADPWLGLLRLMFPGVVEDLFLSRRDEHFSRRGWMDL